MPQAFGGSKITDANQIASGIITNAHINAAAAIASTKLSGVTEFLKSLVAAEALTAFQGIFIGDGVTERNLLTYLDGTTNISFGSTSQTEIAQTIAGSEVNSIINKITIILKKVSSPTDNVVLQVRSGSETGTLLGSASIAGGSLTTSFVNYELTLDTPVSMVSGTTYYLVIKRDGALDGVNYYGAGKNPTSVYSGGIARWKNATVWADLVDNDLSFKLTGPYTSGQMYNSLTTTAALAALVSGIIGENVSLGASSNLQVGGIITNAGWSWTPGKIVYATDTAGALSHTPGSQSRAIGRAISATQIAIDIV